MNDAVAMKSEADNALALAGKATGTEWYATDWDGGYAQVYAQVDASIRPIADIWLTDNQSEYDCELITQCRELVPYLAQAVIDLTRDLALAIAHDRQPYPTADAYDKACAALNKKRDENGRLHAVLKELAAEFATHATFCRQLGDQFRRCAKCIFDDAIENHLP